MSEHRHRFVPFGVNVQGFELQYTGLVEWRCECGRKSYTRASLPEGADEMGFWFCERAK